MMVSLLSLVSCGSPYRAVMPYEIIENDDLSFVAPSTQFKIDKDYSTLKKSHAYKHLNLIDFNKKGMEFKIYAKTYNKFPQELFKRNASYKDSDIREDVITKREKETNITYKKTWITYVKGIRCQGYVFSRGFGGSYAPFVSKDYMISCGYYDKRETKNNGKKILSINYIYNTDPKHNYEQELKHIVKKVISTLKIKNIDTARMKREGLLYPHKRFKSTKW